MRERGRGAAAEGAAAPPSSPDARCSRRRARGPLAFACAALAVAGCDNAFDPIAESEVHLSVFGYLDAAADTQWVRVVPIRPVATPDDGPSGIAVALEEVGTGRVLAMRDTLLRFSGAADEVLGGGSLPVHDFWTTEPIRAGACSTTTSIRDGGSTAAVRALRLRDAENALSRAVSRPTTPPAPCGR